MTEKIFMPIQVYGILTTTAKDRYLLLSPHPITKDSWQLDHQQTWLVVDAHDDYRLFIETEDGTKYAVNQQPHHLVTSFPSIELILMNDWVWSGEYRDTDEQVEVVDEEPTQKDQEWYQMNMFPEFKAIND